MNATISALNSMGISFEFKDVLNSTFKRLDFKDCEKGILRFDDIDHPVDCKRVKFRNESWGTFIASPGLREVNTTSGEIFGLLDNGFVGVLPGHENVVYTGYHWSFGELPEIQKANPGCILTLTSKHVSKLWDSLYLHRFSEFIEEDLKILIDGVPEVKAATHESIRARISFKSGTIEVPLSDMLIRCKKWAEVAAKTRVVYNYNMKVHPKGLEFIQALIEGKRCKTPDLSPKDLFDLFEALKFLDLSF